MLKCLLKVWNRVFIQIIILFVFVSYTATPHNNKHCLQWPLPLTARIVLFYIILLHFGRWWSIRFSCLVWYWRIYYLYSNQSFKLPLPQNIYIYTYIIFILYSYITGEPDEFVVHPFRQSTTEHRVRRQISDADQQNYRSYNGRTGPDDIG